MNEEKNIICDKYFPKILKLLSTDEYVTSKRIAKELQISEKTARVKVNQLSQILEENGAIMKSKKGVGYILEIVEEEKYNTFFRDFTNRIFKYDLELILILLWENDYIKIEDIVDILYMSRNTITKELKQIEQELESYSLRLDRKPNYGIYISGDEFRKRMLLLDINKKKRNHNISKYLDVISAVMSEIFEKNSILVSNICFENLSLYLAISI